MQKLDELFVQNDFVFVHGRSGTGKTLLARQYAYKKRERESNFIFRFVKSDKLQSEFKYISDYFYMQRDKYKDEQEFLTELVKRLNYYAVSNQFMFLFIIDNVNENKVPLSLLKCGFNKNFKFLFTTKSPKICPTYGSMELEPFDEKKCLELIKQRGIFDRATNETEWIEILKLLGSKDKVAVLPLKLNKLAEMTRELHWKANRIREFLQTYKENLFGLVKTEMPFAFDVLTLFSYLKESNISEELIKSYFSDKSTEEIEKALDYLLRSSEIILNAKGDFDIHELTQEEVFEENSNTKDEAILDRIVNCLEDLLKKDNIEFKNSLELQKGLQRTHDNLYSHAEHVLKSEWSHRLESESCLFLYRQLGLINQKIYMAFPKAEKFYDEALKIANKIFKPDHKERARLFSYMGTLLFSQGAHEKALANMNEALSIHRRLWPVDELTIATCLIHIAMVQHSREENDQALQNLIEALEIQKSFAPADHSRLAATLERIALIYMSQSLSDKAAEYLNETFNMYTNMTFEENELPELSPLYIMCETIIDQNSVDANLFENFNKTFSPANSKSISKSPIQMNVSHPNIAALLSHMATFYLKQGEYDKALQKFDESQTMADKVLPPDHPYRANLLSNIGMVYNHQGLFEKALENFSEALQISRKSLPPEHPRNFVLLCNIATVYIDLDRVDAALVTLNEALEIRMHFEVDQPTTVAILNSIGAAYMKQSLYTKALSTFLSALDMCRKTEQTVDSRIAGLYSNIGLAYLSLGEYDQALQNFNEAFKYGIVQVPGQVGIFYHNIAGSYFEQGECRNSVNTDLVTNFFRS